jgi:hypothetical protein
MGYMKNVMMTNQNSLFTSAKTTLFPQKNKKIKLNFKIKTKEALIRYLNHHFKFTFILPG